MASTLLLLNRSSASVSANSWCRLITRQQQPQLRTLTNRYLRINSQFGKNYKHGLATFNNTTRQYKTSCFLHNLSQQESEISNAYQERFRASVEDPTTFWAEAAEELIWHKKWDQVMDNSNPPFTKWFAGGELNIVYNAVDRHVENGLGDRVALIHDSPVTNTIRKITYSELLQEVKNLAGVLRKHGVEKGDRVLIYMPAIPQAVVSMFASARIGAIHSLVFGGFGAKELSARINHAKPKVIMSANCGIETAGIVNYKSLLDQAVEISSHKPQKCIIYNRPQGERAQFTKDLDLCYMEELAAASPVDCVPIPAMDPLYILYTSGTTGLPKAIVRPNAGHAVALKWGIQNIYGCRPGEVWWAASDLGWVVGHSQITYGPLLNANTSILFEGKPIGTPDAGTYFRVLKEHDVAVNFMPPSSLRVIIKEDPTGECAKQYLPLDKFKYMFVGGEYIDKNTMLWTRELINKPVLDNYGQTETCLPLLADIRTNMNSSVGVCGKPVPGRNVKVIVSDTMQEAKVGELGHIVVKLPLPPGAFSSLWENEDGYKNIYFTNYPGYFDTMDSGVRDKDGYISVLSRTDDVIKVAGNRLSTGVLEEAIMQITDVADVVVIGVPDEYKGQVPLALCVLKSGVGEDNQKVIHNVIQKVYDNIGPVANFNQAIVVPGLPRTRSGKVARNTIAAMAAGKPFKIPVTIDDPSVYPPIRTALQSIGFPREVTAKQL